MDARAVYNYSDYRHPREVIGKAAREHHVPGRFVYANTPANETFEPLLRKGEVTPSILGVPGRIAVARRKHQSGSTLHL